MIFYQNMILVIYFVSCYKITIVDDLEWEYKQHINSMMKADPHKKNQLR